MLVPLIQPWRCANSMAGTSDCKDSHLEMNGGSRVLCARKRPLHPREELVVRRVRFLAPGFHAEVVKDRAKVNGDSSCCHPLQSSSAVTPSQRKICAG